MAWSRPESSGRFRIERRVSQITALACGNVSAFGGIRTPSLVIRSYLYGVQRRPDRSATWHDRHSLVRTRSPGVRSRSLRWLPGTALPDCLFLRQGITELARIVRGLHAVAGRLPLAVGRCFCCHRCCQPVWPNGLAVSGSRGQDEASIDWTRRDCRNARPVSARPPASPRAPADRHTGHPRGSGAPSPRRRGIPHHRGLPPRGMTGEVMLDAHEKPADQLLPVGSLRLEFPTSPRSSSRCH